MNNEPPKAKEKPYRYSIGDYTIDDEYAWIRDTKWPKAVDNPDILAYLRKENAYAEGFFEQFSDLKTQIFEELKGRIKLEDQSYPMTKGDYDYYMRTLEDKNYPIYCRKYKGLDSKEEIILDVNKLATEKSFVNVGRVIASPDNTFLAYSVDYSGDEKYVINIISLDNRYNIKSTINNCGKDLVWKADNTGVFYVPVDEDLRHTKVMFHQASTSSTDDILVFHEQDILYHLSISASSSHNFLMINSSGHDNNEYYVIDVTSDSLKPRLIIPREDGVFYSVNHNSDYFYILTNDIGSNCRLLTMEVKSSKIKEYIRIDNKKYLFSFDITKNYLVVNYKSDGLSEIIVINLKTTHKQNYSFPDEAYVANGFCANFNFDDIRINYSSLGRPNTLYSCNTKSGTLEVLKVQEIPAGFCPEEYEVKRIWADNKGTAVPISLLYKKSLYKSDGSNPLYLYGYGSYGIAVEPSFRSNIFSLIDRGFVFAIAHIRGGDDLGYSWYESAKFLTKKRTFEDFISCAEYLISEKYTSAGSIIIAGGSAGGMLVGAVMNERPDLFKAVIAHVPFVDVLNTMLDETLPLTPGEFKEWGNPKDPEYFDYIKSYSPYDNIKTQNYPSLFVTSGISDPRVGYWEPAKWVARLRKIKLDDNVIIFKTNMDSGHQGASGRFDYLQEIADDYVFMIYNS